MTLPFKRTVWGVQSTHGASQTVDGKFSAKNKWDRKGWRREGERGREWKEHKRQREENPQKPRDVAHQRAIPTCLTLHFQLDAKSSTWGCRSLRGRRTSRPAAAFDRSQCARVTHLPATCWGFFFRRQETPFFWIYSEASMGRYNGNNGQSWWAALFYTFQLYFKVYSVGWMVRHDGGHLRWLKFKARRDHFLHEILSVHQKSWMGNE